MVNLHKIDRKLYINYLKDMNKISLLDKDLHEITNKVADVKLKIESIKFSKNSIPKEINQNNKEIDNLQTDIRTSFFKRIFCRKCLRKIQSLLITNEQLNKDYHSLPKKKERLLIQKENLIVNKRELENRIKETQVCFDKDYLDFNKLEKYFIIIKQRAMTFVNLDVNSLRLNFRLFGTTYTRGYYINNEVLINKLKNWPIDQLNELMKILVSQLDYYKKQVMKNLKEISWKNLFLSETYKVTTDSNFDAFYAAIHSFLSHIILYHDDSHIDIFFSGNFLEVLKEVMAKHKYLMRYNYEHFGHLGTYIDFGFYKIKKREDIKCKMFNKKLAYQLNEITNLSSIVFSTACWFDQKEKSINMDVGIFRMSLDNCPEFLQSDFVEFGPKSFNEKWYSAIVFHERCHMFFDKYILPSINDSTLDQLDIRFIDETFARLATLLNTPLYKFEIYMLEDMMIGNPAYRKSFNWLYHAICFRLGIEPNLENYYFTIRKFLTQEDDEIKRDIVAIYNDFKREFKKITWPYYFTASGRSIKR